MEGIDRLARQWQHLSEDARAYQWQKLSEGDRVALQGALRENPAGHQGGRAARGKTFFVIFLVIAALAAVGLWITTSRLNSSPEVKDYYGTVGDAAASTPEPAVELSRVRRVDGYGSGEYARVGGNVFNSGPGTVRFVEVRCSLVSRSDRTEAAAELHYAVGGEGLPAGSGRDFEVMLRAPEEDWNYFPHCSIVGYRD